MHCNSDCYPAYIFKAKLLDAKGWEPMQIIKFDRESPPEIT